MIVIGLTGGVGSGKTTAAALFADLDMPVIDADQIAREVISPSNDAFAKIVDKLGENILTPEKNIDREKLRHIIFSDRAIKEWLEDLMHPKICEKIRACLTKIDAPYAIIEIPLLLESKQKLPLDRILVITCPQHLRIERVQKRSKLSTLEIEKMIETQASQEQLLNIADEIIHNDQSLQQLCQQIKDLHKKYLRLSTTQHSPKF